MVFPTMGKPLRANPTAQRRVLKPTLSSFPSCVCFLRRPKLYWVETFFPSLFIPPSSLGYLFLKMPSTYSLTHFPFYNALLVGSQWWCFVHLSHGLHFYSRFLIRWGLLMILLKLALDVGWCSAEDFPQGTIVLICSGWIWSPVYQGLTGWCRPDIGSYPHNHTKANGLGPKLLANRLAEWLQYMVNPTQSAFNKKRFI